jgi:hypothetical protein
MEQDDADGTRLAPIDLEHRAIEEVLGRAIGQVSVA